MRSPPATEFFGPLKDSTYTLQQSLRLIDFTVLLLPLDVLALACPHKLAHCKTLSIGFDEVYPLWALTSPDVGGLGWTIFQIGKVRLIDQLFFNISG